MKVALIAGIAAVVAGFFRASSGDAWTMTAEQKMSRAFEGIVIMLLGALALGASAILWLFQ